MKRLCFVLGLLACLSGFNVYATETKKVAVYVTGGDADAGIKKILGDQLVSAFTSSGRYIAVERTNSFLAELRKEQFYQQTGAVDDRELSRLGKQFGVQFVCVADINEAFGKKYISSRLIDAESAEVVNTANETSELKDMAELLRVSKSLAKVLTGKTEKERLEEKEAAAAAYKESKERREKEKAETIAKAEQLGYIEVGDLMVTYPPTSSIPWKSADDMAATVRTGRFYDWRLPTTGEASLIVSRLLRYDIKTWIWTSSGCGGKNFYVVRLGDTYCASWNHNYPAVFVRKR